MSVSEAELRRQARRQRILANQEQRLQKIMGPNARIPASISTDLYDEDTGDTEASSLLQQQDHTLLLSSTAASASSSSTKANVSDDPAPPKIITPSPPVSELKKSAGDNDVAVAGSKLAIKTVTKRQHHTILFLLGVMLSVLRGSYFFLYFILYQISLFTLNGYGPPIFYNVSSSFLTAVAMFGMPEGKRKLFRDFLITLNWLTTDVTIFISSALFPIFVTYCLKGQ